MFQGSLFQKKVKLYIVALVFDSKPFIVILIFDKLAAFCLLDCAQLILHQELNLVQGSIKDPTSTKGVRYVVWVPCHQP